jgi:hypothetical protein
VTRIDNRFTSPNGPVASSNWPVEPASGSLRHRFGPVVHFDPLLVPDQPQQRRAIRSSRSGRSVKQAQICVECVSLAQDVGMAESAQLALRVRTSQWSSPSFARNRKFPGCDHTQSSFEEEDQSMRVAPLARLITANVPDSPEFIAMPTGSKAGCRSKLHVPC